MDGEIKSFMSFIKMLGLAVAGSLAVVAAIKIAASVVEVAFK